jgi:hypothetical protein
MESVMETIPNPLAEPVAIPPMDAAAPHKFDTATFGLG